MGNETMRQYRLVLTAYWAVTTSVGLFFTLTSSHNKRRIHHLGLQRDRPVATV